jgi:Domain of unknown function (DUF4157)
VSTPTKTASKTETGAAKAPTPASRFSSSRSVLLQRKCACGGGGTAASTGTGAGCESCQKKEAEEQKKAQEQKLQKSSSGPSRSATAPPVVNQVLSSPGRALDTPTRSFMEPRFGRDFSGVVIHTDSRAAESARAVDAHAYTVGQHIVFDQGKYDPDSRGGQHLLAHELAHTVQQHGLQRSSENLSLVQTPEYRHLEREADTVAHSLMSGAASPGAPALSRHPAQPLLSRADKTEGEKARDWENPDPALKEAGVKKVSRPGDEVEPGTATFNMGTLPLPKEKGDVLSLWKPLADAKQLQAIVEGDSAPFVALKQDRPSPPRLRNIWLQKVGWSPDEARGKWKDAALKSTATDDRAKAIWDPPKVQGSECQVDHMVELQFGGSSDRENVQMLDGDDNMKAGGYLYNILRKKYGEVRKTLDGDKKQKAIKTVIMLFDGVEQPKPTAGPCAKVENWVRTHANEAVSGESIKETKSGTPYPIYIGKFAPTSLIVSGDFESNPKLAMPIRTSTVPENKSAATLIPGFLLDTLHRNPGKGKDTIDAALDTRVGTQLPITLKNEKDVTLNVAADGKLTLPKKRPNLAFHYPYLSDGVIEELEVAEDGSLSGKGTIKSSIPFLPQLHVKFDKESFALVAPLDAKKLKPPIPGAKITEGEIGLQLAPQFKPYGMLAFELVTGPKKILDGKIDVTGDAQGLVATGVVHVFLPGVDNAEGNIKYQSGEWSGGVKIESTQMQSKLKYVKSGSVVVGLSSKGVSAEGKVGLDIPGTSGVDVSLLYEKHKWIFRGKGAFTPPKLKPVEIEIEYDGDHITGSAETGFEFHGLAGRLKVQYRDERFSGEGTINIKKGRAEGKLHIKMRQEKGEPKFSGEGEVTYKITDNLIGTAGIEVNEQEEVRLKGALQFPKPIHLFDPIKGDYKIFEVGVSIPIPGASIGPVGLNARIDGALSAGYQIGPGELRNAKIEAAFNPLEEKPDLDVLMGAQLYIGARAYVSGSISGSIEVSVGIASVSGGLTITATASLEGHVASEVKIHYQKSRFEIDANFELLLALALTLALDAFVKAKAGVGPFSVETKKVWNLASFKFDTGMQLGMKLKSPIHYASDEPFKSPSLDDIQWIKPDIDPKKVLERAFGSGSSKEEEGGK